MINYPIKACDNCFMMHAVAKRVCNFCKHVMIKPKIDGAWPCGHPRTAENTRKIGKAGVRCRTCRMAICERSRLKCTS